MDIKKLQGVLMLKGIRVAADDPVFTLVALNEVVLEEMTHKLQQTIVGAGAASRPPASQAVSMLKTMAVCVLAFSGGMFIGTRETPLLQVSLGVILGVLIGIALSLVVIARIERYELSPSEVDVMMKKMLAKEKDLWKEKVSEIVQSELKKKSGNK